MATAVQVPYRATVHKKRPERQRDLLFGAGCGLFGLALIPFGVAIDSDSGDAESQRTGDVDNATRRLCAAFALLGLLSVALSCAVLSHTRLRPLISALLATLVVVSGMGASTAMSQSVTHDALHLADASALSTQDELLLARCVNSLVCHVHARRVCSLRDRSHAPEEARAVRDAPRLQASAMSTVCRHVLHEQPDVTEIQVGAWVTAPSAQASQWCLTFLETGESDAWLEHSPYYQHHERVMARVRALLARHRANARLLHVLDWLALHAIAALTWWRCRLPTTQIHALGRPDDACCDDIA